MLSRKQVWVLSFVAVTLWVGATAAIRLFPAALTDSVSGNLMFLASIPMCWLCVRAAWWGASLEQEQVVAGTAFVVALAMLIDASALRWAPFVYGADGPGGFFRLGSAWLLWGYGVSLAISLLMAGAGRARAGAGQALQRTDR